MSATTAIYSRINKAGAERLSVLEKLHTYTYAGGRTAFMAPLRGSKRAMNLGQRVLEAIIEETGGLIDDIAGDFEASQAQMISRFHPEVVDKVLKELETADDETVLEIVNQLSPEATKQLQKRVAELRSRSGESSGDGLGLQSAVAATLTRRRQKTPTKKKSKRKNPK